VDIGEIELFREVVHAAFGQRRKMLRNALAGLASQRGLGPGAAAAAFVRAGVDPAARGETLDLEAFARLARAFDS
jgi:16S rRNA (adenine1518-N6/adenine1519-N6)-dimethyltransferase